MKALTIHELRKRDQARHYSAAMQKRWKDARRQARTEQVHLGRMGFPSRGALPVNAREKAHLDVALKLGWLTTRVNDERAYRLEAAWWNACRDLGKPFAVVQSEGRTCTLFVDYPMRSGQIIGRQFAEDCLYDFEKLVLAPQRATSRRMEWSYSPEYMSVRGVRVGQVEDLMRALLHDLGNREVDDNGSWVDREEGGR